LGSVSSLVSEKRIFEISANQSILLALAAMLNFRLERKTYFALFVLLVLYLLAIALSILRFLDSDYLCGIVKLFFCNEKVTLLRG
jgi:hypothetical protein